MRAEEEFRRITRQLLGLESKVRGIQTENILSSLPDDYLKLDASNGPITGQLASSVSTGTAPLSIASTTVNTNFNADMIDGFHIDELGGVYLASVGWSFIIPAVLGIAAYVEIPFDVTITEVTLVGDVSGSCVIDIWMDTYANFPPTNADTITSSTPPTLSSAQKYQDNTLTGWTVDLLAGSWLAFNVDSFTTVAQVTLAIKGNRT